MTFSINGLSHATLSQSQVWTQPPLVGLYKWCQSPLCVYVAVHAPTAFVNQPVAVELTGRELLLQPHGAPPVLRRRLAHAVDSKCPMHVTRCAGEGKGAQNHVRASHRTEDGRFWVLVLPKASPEPWHRLFDGDSLGARRLPALTTLTAAEDSLHVEVQLPRWMTSDDVHVCVQPRSVCIDTPLGTIVRTLDGCTTLDQATWDVDRGAGQTVVTVSLAVRSGDNTCAPCFEEDRDEFGLDALLQGAIFAATGGAPLVGGGTVTHEARLPAAARAMLQAFRATDDSAL